MKKLSSSLCLAAMALSCAGAAMAQTSVGVSVQVAQPGVYGRIDIGNMPPPPVVYAKPVVIVAQPAVPVQPVYLYVPPGHQKNWRKHCHRYNACGQPVYFVKERWVHERYEREHGHKHGHKHKHDKHDKHSGKGHGKHD